MPDAWTIPDGAIDAMHRVTRGGRFSKATRYAAVLMVVALATACGGGGGDAGPTGDAVADEVQPPVAPPTREELLLIQRMRAASEEEIVAFMRAVLDEPLPEDYVIPQYVYEAGDPATCSAWIGERYPEFHGKQGSSLIDAVGREPVRYRELIRVSKAMRMVYAGHLNTPAGSTAAPEAVQGTP
jgi:hypothetical protein